MTKRDIFVTVYKNTFVNIVNYFGILIDKICVASNSRSYILLKHTTNMSTQAVTINHHHHQKLPFSIDWILRKESVSTSNLDSRVDKIKNVIRVYEEANPFRYPSYYKDLSLVKYKIEKCSPKSSRDTETHRVGFNGTSSPPPTPTMSSTSSKPPSPVNSSCTCQSTSHNNHGGRVVANKSLSAGFGSAEDNMNVYDDVFMDDRITMTTLPSKVIGK